MQICLSCKCLRVRHLIGFLVGWKKMACSPPFILTCSALATHSGALKQFNYYFIHRGDGTFTSDDYQIIARAEQIRTFSDYDDFYIAGKQETREQVTSAEEFLGKTEKYLLGLEGYQKEQAKSG